MIKRRNRFAYALDINSNSKSICSECFNVRNITSYTVPYVMANGVVDKGVKKCEYCFAIIPVKQTRFSSSEGQPLGFKQSGETKFEVAEFSKSRRIRHREDNDVFKVEDYKLPNGEVDKDLVHYASQGEIVSVTDSGNDSDELE